MGSRPLVTTSLKAVHQTLNTIPVSATLLCHRRRLMSTAMPSTTDMTGFSIKDHHHRLQAPELACKGPSATEGLSRSVNLFQSLEDFLELFPGSFDDLRCAFRHADGDVAACFADTFAKIGRSIDGM